MPGFVQLDLFGDRPEPNPPAGVAAETPIAPEGLSDDDLISAISNTTFADAFAITTEVGKRRLNAAVPALISLCKRFVGYGASAVVPEQVAALNALGAIGGQEAAQAVSTFIAKKIVQGPTLVIALTVASQVGVVLPGDVALRLLRDPDSSLRSAACGCVRASHEIIAALVTMMGDPNAEVAIASACALGRMRRIEALGPLKRYLIERPSSRIVEALAGVADDEAVVFLARTGKERRELIDSAISSLEEVESARAARAADALKKLAAQS